MISSFELYNDKIELGEHIVDVVQSTKKRADFPEIGNVIVLSSGQIKIVTLIYIDFV